MQLLRHDRLDRLKQGNAPAIILRGIWLRGKALGSRLQKLFLRKVMASLFPDRVLLKTVRLLNIYGDNSYDGSVASVHDLTLVSRYKEYVIEDAREREYPAHSRFSNGKIYSVTSFVCTIDNARFHVGDGVVCTSDNCLIMDSTCDEGRLVRSSAYGQLIPHPSWLAGTYSTIWNMYADNHFHWLFESLPRLYSLKVATDEPLTLLMPRDLKADYKATLSYCLPSNAEVVYLPRRKWVQVQKFVLPSYVITGDPSRMLGDHTQYVRSRILDGLNLSTPPTYERNIYITRRKARLRRVSNEDELLDVLVKFGFEIYVLEDMTLVEQVRLFHSANVVVAPHGAGLANILFSGKIKVLELTSPLQTLAYFMICQTLGQEYHYLHSPQTKRDEDFRVDVGAVRELLPRLLRD